MKIREYAKNNGHTVVGVLKYCGVVDHARMYIDEAGNEYYIDTALYTVCIVTADGAVI